jgi:hypothetical protein
MAIQELGDARAGMARQTAEDRSPALAGWQLSRLADGSTRLTTVGRAWWRGLIREEWRIRRGQIERRRIGLGGRRVQRFTGGALWLEHRRRGAAVERALVVRAGRGAGTVAAGEESELRALGVLMAERAGWRYRVSNTAPPATGLGAFSLPVVLIAGGLLVALAGFVQARSETAAIRRLTPITPAGLATLQPGATALATGAVSGAAEDRARGFVFYDLYEFRGRGRYGGGWFWMDSPRPDFQLSQPGGLVPVVGDHAALIRPPHRSREGWRSYEGFRVSDTATVMGRVAVDRDGRHVLTAVTIFGGGRAAYIHDQERAGFGMGGMGLVAAMAGAAIFRVMRRVG